MTPQTDNGPDALFALIARESLVSSPAKPASTSPAPAPAAWLEANGMHIDHVAEEDIRVPLAGQLGPRWSSFAALSKPRRLLALLLASTVRDGGPNERQRAASADTSLDVLLGALSHLEKTAEELCLKAAKTHAYETTVLLAAMEAAWRDTGVRWRPRLSCLQTADPVLWAMIDDFMRPNRRLDVYGIVSHYRAECSRKAPIEKPNVVFAAMNVHGMKDLT